MLAPQIQLAEWSRCAPFQAIQQLLFPLLSSSLPLPMKLTQISISCFLWRTFPYPWSSLTMPIRVVQLIKQSHTGNLGLLSHKHISLPQTLAGIWASSSLAWGVGKQSEEVKYKAFIFLLKCLPTLRYLPTSPVHLTILLDWHGFFFLLSFACYSSSCIM